MRRPLILAVILAAALILVLVSQARLRKAVEEGRLEEPVPGEAPERAQDQADLAKPDEMKAKEEEPQANEMKVSPKDQVIAALLETRETFRSQETVTKEAQENPHTTPPSIVNAASKLADLAALEHQYPEFQGDFQNFYLECARDEAVITVTRAQCLAKYFQSRQADSDERAKILQTMPPSVSRLYKEIDQG